MRRNKTYKLNRKVGEPTTKEDYSSKNGMMPKTWGPATWHLLHSTSFNYPVEPTIENKQNYRKFVHNLQHILPCGKCRENYKKNLQSMPLTLRHMKSRNTFSKYIYKLHEKTNKMLHKPSRLSYEKVRSIYEKYRFH